MTEQQERSVRARLGHDSDHDSDHDGDHDSEAPSPGGITLAELKARHEQYRREEVPLMLEMRGRVAKALAREEAELQETRKRVRECYMRSDRAHIARRLQARCRGFLTRRSLKH